MTVTDRLQQINAARQTLQLPELALSYLEWHPGGEPVLLLHGLADQGMVWAECAMALGDRWHCVAPDLRGHGESSKPEQGYQCDDIIADLEALMTHLGWSSVHVIAHSWGAKVAAVWATQSPQRFRSFVLVDPFFIDRIPAWTQVTIPWLYRVLPFLKMMGPFDRLEEAEAIARGLKQYQGWSEFQQALFYSSLEQKSDGRWGSKFVVAARDGVFADVMQVSGLTQVLMIPSLLILPKAGINRSHWQIKSYYAYLVNLQVTYLASHHWCFLADPEPFHAAVQQFLNTGCCREV